MRVVLLDLLVQVLWESANHQPLLVTPRVGAPGPPPRARLPSPRCSAPSLERRKSADFRTAQGPFPSDGVSQRYSYSCGAEEDTSARSHRASCGLVDWEQSNRENVPTSTGSSTYGGLLSDGGSSELSEAQSERPGGLGKLSKASSADLDPVAASRSSRTSSSLEGALHLCPPVSASSARGDGSGNRSEDSACGGANTNEAEGENLVCSGTLPTELLVQYVFARLEGASEEIHRQLW